jgi:hypothetical protein
MNENNSRRSLSLAPPANFVDIENQSVVLEAQLLEPPQIVTAEPLTSRQWLESFWRDNQPTRRPAKFIDNHPYYYDIYMLERAWIYLAITYTMSICDLHFAGHDHSCGEPVDRRFTNINNYLVASSVLGLICAILTIIFLFWFRRHYYENMFNYYNNLCISFLGASIWHTWGWVFFFNTPLNQCHLSMYTYVLLHLIIYTIFTFDVLAGFFFTSEKMR